MKLLQILSTIVLLSLACFVLYSYAASVPTTLSYQGTLTDKNGGAVSGSTQLTFSLYSSSGVRKNPFYSETQTIVLPTNGQFATMLGSANPPLKIGKNFSGNTTVGITVVNGNDPELTPRQQLTSVPYAMNGVPPGGIIMWSGKSGAVPDGWTLCDGSNGAPDLLGKFIIGANPAAPVVVDPISIVLDGSGGSSNHFHKGSSEGGNLKAAIGAVDSNTSTIGYAADDPFNPNVPAGNLSYLANMVLMGTGGGAGTFGPTHYTKVLGYTSVPFQGVPVPNGNAAAVVGSLPPYYALAYIMKL